MTQEELLKIQNSGLTGVAKSIMGTSGIESAKRDLSALSEMGRSFMQGQVQAAGQDIYKKRQQILESQRRYGITGAVANAQLQDFELRAQKQMSDVVSQSSMNWYKTFGAQYQQLSEMQNQMRTSKLLGAWRNLSRGNFSSAKQAYSVISGIDENVTQFDVEQAMQNKNWVQDLLLGRSGGLQPLDSDREQNNTQTKSNTQTNRLGYI